MSYQPDTEWKMDPVLEISVEVEDVGVTVHLTGILNRQTGCNVRSVVKELVDDDTQYITMDLVQLDGMDAAGVAALAAIQRDVRSKGGLVTWLDLGRSNEMSLDQGMT